MISSSFRFLIALVVLACACDGATPLDGYTFGAVTLSDGGRISFVKDLKWAWHRPGHPVEYFTLVGRDKWSVYLCGNGPYGFQVDWYAGVRKAIFKSRTHPWSYYPITSAAIGIINGRNIGKATFDGGNMVQVAPTKWELKTTNVNTVYQFIETHRDEWSVYLRPSHLKSQPTVQVQIDYFLKSIFFRAGGKVFAQFKITGADYSTHYDYKIDSFTCQ